MLSFDENYSKNIRTSQPVLIIINKIIDNTRFLQDTVCKYLEEKVFEDEKYLYFLLDVIKFLNKCLIINTKSIKININLNEHKTNQKKRI